MRFQPGQICIWQRRNRRTNRPEPIRVEVVKINARTITVRPLEKLWHLHGLPNVYAHRLEPSHEQ